MSVYVIKDTNTVAEGFIITARAIITRDWATRKINDEIDVYWAMVRGMTDNGQPGWDNFCEPIFFKTFEEAEASLHQGGQMWGFKVIEGTSVIRKRIIRSSTYVVDYDV